MVIDEYFKDSELYCKCGCGMRPSKLAVELLYALRLIYGRAIHVSSGARCSAHNIKIGGFTWVISHK